MVTATSAGSPESARCAVSPAISANTNPNSPAIGTTYPSVNTDPLDSSLISSLSAVDRKNGPAPDERWGETPKAFFVPESCDPGDADATPEELKTFVRERVADYKTPGEVAFVEALPTTATGKIQKYELREREWDEEERLVGEG